MLQLTEVDFVGLEKKAYPYVERVERWALALFAFLSRFCR